MRKSTVLWLVLSVFFAASLNAAVIDESLQSELNQLSAGENVRALVYFEHQADIVSLDKQLKLNRATLVDRNRAVILALQEAATLTQPEVISFLENLKSQGMVKEYHMFWIANMFSVEATTAGIMGIAARQDLATLYNNFPIETISPVKSEQSENLIASVEIGLERINAPAAWAQGWTGAGRVVMNIDTGVDGNHPAYADRFRGDVNNNGTYEESWFDPYDTHWPFPQDGGSHGTHTMGTICGRSPAGDTIGVAIDAQWIAAAAIDRGGGIPRTVADAILSFEWAADPDGDPNTQDNPDACGNSWGVTTSHGYPPCDQTFWTVIDNLEFAGTAVIFSAGNEGSAGLRRPADRGTTPYNCFSVGAVDGTNPNLPIAYFSSLGPTNCGPNGETVIKPEVVAPGVNVRSAQPGGGYQTMSGTSMASPHVTGAVAVIRSVNPDLDVDTIKEILMSTSHDLPFSNPDGEDNTYGHGVIDLYEACLIAQSGYGFIMGSVTDSNNNGIGGAVIEIINSPRFTFADENGDYFLGLPADTAYDVRASFFGYIPEEDTASITPDDTTMLDFTLQLAPFGNLHGNVISAEDSSVVVGANVEVADSPLDPVQTDTAGNYFFPAIPGGSTYLIRVRATGFGIGEDSVFIPTGGNPELNFSLNPFESFENGNAGWEGDGVWQWGAPTSGPGSAFDGTNVWATELGGQYPNNADDGLVTRSYLIEEDAASLNFYHWYNLESGWDGGNVSLSIDGGNTWQLIVPDGGYPDQDVVGLDNDPGFSGNSDWALVAFDLSSYTGQVVKFRYRFGSDGSVTRDGWYLDAFVVNGGSLVYEGTPVITTTPPSFNVQLQQGESTDQTLTIGNEGDALLVYSIRAVTNSMASAPGNDPVSNSIDPIKLNPDWGKHITHERNGDMFRVTYDGPKPASIDNGTNPPMTTDFGGPDDFGYMWFDSNEPNGPAFNWIDVSSIGQPLSFSDDDNQGPFGLGFDVQFYENMFNSIRICSNGWFSFTSTSTSLFNSSIPNSAEPNNLMAPFWDDLNPSQGGSIYFYTNNVDTAIVQYDAVPHYGGSGTYTFQAILTADGNITFQYLSVSGTLNSNTVGIENADGSIGLEVAYNQNYAADGLAVQFRMPVFWLAVDPASGNTEPDSSDDITVTFDAAELDEGEYAGYVEVTSNDPVNTIVSVICTLTVSGIVGIDDIASNIPTAFALDQNFPNPFNPSTEISFALPRSGEVKLTVFDLLGRQVKTLVSGELNAGYQTVTWDGSGSSGKPVASGVYFYSIEAGDFQMTRKMIMLK